MKTREKGPKEGSFEIWNRTAHLRWSVRLRTLAHIVKRKYTMLGLLKDEPCKNAPYTNKITILNFFPSLVTQRASQCFALGKTYLQQVVSILPDLLRRVGMIPLQCTLDLYKKR